MPVCDDLTPPMPEGAPPARVIFMHADNPRQHSLALFNHPHPAGVIHLMVEVSTLDEVGSALDRVKKLVYPLWQRWVDTSMTTCVAFMSWHQVELQSNMGSMGY